MARPTKKNVPTDAEVTAAAGAGPDDGKLPAELLDLVELWRAYRRQGLEVRHQTGLRLNQLLGSPEERQAYGSNALRRFSNRLRVAESDLSRMRWFAHRFPSLADFRDQNPKATTWTRVKLLLPRPRPEGEGGSPASAAEGRTAAAAETGTGRGSFRSVVRALGAAREGLAGLVLKPDDPERPRLDKAVEDILAAVFECTGVRYVRVSEDVPPPAALGSDPVSAEAGVLALVS